MHEKITFGYVMIGNDIYELAKALWDVPRSITGDGVRRTLSTIKELCPELTTYEVPSGQKVFDWEVPLEWNIKDAYVEDPDGNRIVDFKQNNLHVMGYSTPIDTFVSLEELLLHTYTQEDRVNAIPYVTSYYEPKWGFCMSEVLKRSLKRGKYRVYIDASLEPGFLTYGEILLEGEEKEEVLISTYICHPSLGNNELSGPCLTAFLSRWLSNNVNRRYTYRIVFLPETIGSIAYLSRNVHHLKKYVIAGFNVTCVGDENAYSFLPSRLGNTYADKVAKNTLDHLVKEYRSYSYLDRGSDERQYCSPGVDLPVVSIMRSKYGEYPEYHTSDDNLEFITPKGLEGAFNAISSAIYTIENDHYPKYRVLCEPQLGKRGLYPNTGQKGKYSKAELLTHILAYSDGKHSILDISDILNVSFREVYENCQTLLESDLIEYLSLLPPVQRGKKYE
ncbi:DUF4910 domain-containing protein [Pseudobacteriovorax antillogorgiicola]|uniref:Aminopeptidase-like domain-containing protein n=1 Tax=Pseudobacteriovorax antillogorgiicola TaxID=1513793 RepID=A0A1Y6CML6_9BACT|nr:DUF4910 domain-containing protein [Pseudobacteriovorax antillogorgiicola]TCS45204.1 aminopeptidase-like protein [Pseudobacteriovorax antillogorgiicola]SMF75517.1 aminopeptidase-like domain-containing protein [Pseudobacteriovorax antillogorgiicola]